MTWRDTFRTRRSLEGRGLHYGRVLGPAVTRLLREEHTPPDDPRYWGLLEMRIMDGIRRSAVAQPGDPTASAVTHPSGNRGSAGWSAAFSAWARAGVAAAGIAAFAAALAAWSTNTTETRIAYQTVVDVPGTVPIQADTRFINVSEQEATDRYVFSH